MGTQKNNLNKKSLAPKTNGKIIIKANSQFYIQKFVYLDIYDNKQQKKDFYGNYLTTELYLRLKFSWMLFALRDDSFVVVESLFAVAYTVSFLCSVLVL